MQTIKQQIKTNGILTTITNKTANTSSRAWGIFDSRSQKLINRAKSEHLKVYTNNKGESFIAIPSHSL